MTSLPMRELGHSQLHIAPLVFGGNVFGWSVDQKRAFELLDAFVDAGFNMIDTADVYSEWVPGNQGGESETIIGQWLAQGGKRDRVVLATKVAKWSVHRGLSAKTIRAAVEDSLRRLQTDVIDLYQAHEDDPATPLEETLGAFADLIREGKVRAIGASNYSAERLSEALEVSRNNDLPRYETLQPEYNLYDRHAYEDTLEPVALKAELGVISYYSLASGFLTGKYRSPADAAHSTARGNKVVETYLNPRGERILDALDQVAQAHHATPAQVALAWLIARPSITAPIASATSIVQLADILFAAQLPLTDADIEVLDSAST